MAAAAGAALLGHAQVGQLAVGHLHELLQAGLEISGACVLGSGCGSGTGLVIAVAALAGAVVVVVGAGSALTVLVETGGTFAVLVEGAAAAALTVPLGVLGTGRRGCGLLDGQIDAACLVDAHDLDLDLLAFRQEVLYVGHVGVGDLRDVDQTGPSAGQGHKCAEFGDTFDVSFQDCAYTDFHMY